MTILIIEDDPNKLKQLASHVRETMRSAEIVEASSYQSGLKAILADKYDLCILDMTMPNYEAKTSAEGGRQRPFAGRDILREVKRKSISVPIVVVTQFDTFGQGRKVLKRDELARELRKTFTDIFCGMIYYSASRTDWKKQLTRVLIAKVEEQ
ncbi:response regulator [Enhygromyxa salina]|uniref:response regulator n=1 Tax=Enhygromyxa salina TaxID=215803 RepID=UPI000D096B96|nr:response regulator [Enhygromyxa salina]